MGVLENQELACFATYGSIVLLKTVFLSPLTGYLRIIRKVFANEEDLAAIGGNKLIADDPVVERVRRCQQNDIENVVPFFALGLLYANFSGASLSTVIWHYRVFAASRLLHTVVYLNAVPQPSRALCYLAGFIVNVSMGVQIIRNTWSF